jgi:hypothetical protein
MPTHSMINTMTFFFFFQVCVGSLLIGVFIYFMFRATDGYSQQLLC